MGAHVVAAKDGILWALRRACARIGEAALAPFESQSRGNVAGGFRQSVGISRETTIGETAKLSGASLQTLLDYEDRWLVRPRMDGDVRLYSGFDRLRIQLIGDAQRQGYALSEIAEQFGLRGRDRGSLQEYVGRIGPSQIAELREVREQQEWDTDEAVARLREAHRRLRGT